MKNKARACIVSKNFRMCQNFSIILSRRKNLELKRQTPPKFKIGIFKKKLNQEDRFSSPFFPWKAVIQVRHPTKITGTACVSKYSQEYRSNHATLSVLFIMSMSYLLKLMHFGIHLPFHYLWGLFCNFTFISVLTIQVWILLTLLFRIAFSLNKCQLFHLN